MGLCVAGLQGRPQSLERKDPRGDSDGVARRTALKMAKPSSFVAEIVERLPPLGARARAMFGGHGVYIEDTMMGLVLHDRLYLKTGDANPADYEAVGSKPFTYARAGGRVIAMTCHEVPADLFDDDEVHVNWAQKALAVPRGGPRRKKTAGGKSKARR
ncbi:MAG: TfoX family protein [Alphaproteobacteria bacterium]|nr:TfoX family protein [Alphaproteobacteria bacterium]